MIFLIIMAVIGEYEYGEILIQLAFIEDEQKIIVNQSLIHKGDILVLIWSATLGLPESSTNVKCITGGHMEVLDNSESLDYIKLHILGD